MTSARPTILARLLRGLAAAIYLRPRLFFYPQMLLFFFCVLYTVRFLEFSTDRSILVSENEADHHNYMVFKSEFRTQDEIVALVESDDLEKNRQFVERLGARLRAEPNLFADVLYNNDVKMLGNKALLFFPESDLETLRDTLREYQPLLAQFAQATNLHFLFRQINARFRRAESAPREESETLASALPALRRIVDQASDALTRPGLPPAPGLTALFDAGPEAEEQVYITFDHGRIFAVTTRATNVELNEAAIRRLRQLVEVTRQEVPGVNAAITGEPVLELDEMVQSQRDTTKASLVSLLLVAVIFVYGYQETGRPIKATACLVVGLAYTLAFATFAIGHLNILTITFVPMLIGLAIDFGVHLVTRYEEELRSGLSERLAIETALVQTGQGIFTGCFTTAGAFLAMCLTDFRGIQEMGLICGGGLLICLVPMTTLLPVLVLRGKQNVLDHRVSAEPVHRARIERLWLRRPWTVLGTGLALCLACAWLGRNVTFDYNLLNLQTRGLPAVVYEKKLIRGASQSVLFCAVITDSLEDAVRLQKTLSQLPTVSGVESMAPYLTEDQSRKLQLIGEIKQVLAPLRFPPLDPDPVEIKELSPVLYSLGGYLGLAAQQAGAEGADAALLGEIDALRASIRNLRRLMNSGAVAENAVRLGLYQRALLGDIQETFRALQTQDNRERLLVDDLPAALRHRFISYNGNRFLLQVHPSKDVWQRDNQVEFIGQLRKAADPDGDGTPVITGTPVQLLQYTTLLKRSYEEAALYALAAIVLLVFIQFRSTVSVLLALLPVGVGTLWMLGYMGWTGLPFNPANIMTLPLVIGIGVTNGIHILTRFVEERSPSLLTKSTGKAIIVSGFTTVVGFGSLMLGQHQGIASLGEVMAVGTTTCMVAALTLLPSLLNLLSRRQGSDRKEKTQCRNRKLVTGLGGTEAKTSSEK